MGIDTRTNQNLLQTKAEKIGLIPWLALAWGQVELSHWDSAELHPIKKKDTLKN